MPDLRDAYQRQSNELRVRLARIITQSWGTLPSFRDADVAAWERKTIAVVEAAQRQSAALTDAYLRTLAQQNMPRALIGDALRDISLRGVPASEVYHRPAVTTYTALSEGKSFDVAKAMGLKRALSLAMTDVQLAKTHTARANQQARRVKYFRRTLTGNENCALCVIASTQRYHVGNLSPIHPGCDCGVEDFSATGDPGQVLDQNLLDATHGLVMRETGGANADARELIDASGHAISLRGDASSASQYRDLIVVRNHGEYGPTLTWAGQQFTGPADLLAA